jgi:hypothetical protein
MTNMITGAVYDPPRPGLPHIAVTFKPDGEVLVARVVPSVAAGEALIQSVMQEFVEKHGLDAGVVKA